MTNSDHVSTDMLADHAEGLLRESDGVAVEAHLSGCADCRAEALLLASLSDILAADDPGPMPAIYAARIDAALAKVAMPPPSSGSFHSDAAFTAGPAPSGALDLTPSALASASAGGAGVGGAGKSAEVIDLAERRRAVAQGLSRVTTVAASIVLLIGGTVLGLQALNQDGGGITDTPGVPVAGESAGPIVAPATRATIQPSPIRNSAVPIYVGAKKNPDGSYTNPNGVVVRKDGSAVLLNGKVLKPDDKKPGKAQGEDPTVPNGPVIDRPADDKVGSKAAVGPLTTADKTDDEKQPDTTLEDPASNGPATSDTATAAPEATPEGSGGQTPDPSVKTQETAAAAEDASETAKAPEPAGSGQKAQTARAQRSPWVEQSGSEYTSDNFAQKVLGLLDRAGYRESSIGEPAVESADPTDKPTSSDFQATSIATAMKAPSAADAPEVSDAAEAEGPAGNDVKRRVQRCARQLNGQAIAGDTGTWKGEEVTIVVMPDPTDSRQVVARAITGPCSPDRPASSEDNVEHTQFIVIKP